MKRSYLMSTALFQAALALGSTGAYAQTTTGPTEQQANDGLSDIIVTAQRRTENLQDVPIAATSLSADALTQKGVTRLSDLQFAAPSLSVSEGGLVQSVNIRGIGIASGSPSVANGVATYVNGIFQPPIVQTNSFFDIASVEVLRGPQGTLVGSNSTGGAIFINSQNPTFDAVNGYVGATYGNYDAVEAQGALNLPVTGDLAVRAAGQFRRRDSFYHDVGVFHNDAGRLNEKAGRFSVLWKPGQFQALLKTELIDLNTGGFAYRPIPGTFAAAGRVGDIRTLSYNTPTAQHEKGFITSAELKYELDNGIVIRSITGYQNKSSDLLIDNDATSLTIPNADINTDQFVRERQTSQEINIISPTNGALDWILGGYYQRNRINVRLHQLNSGFPLDVMQNQTKVTTGLFAQVNYQLTDQFEVQLGGRYSHFKSSGDGAVAIGAGIPGFPADGLTVADLQGSSRDGKVTGKLALNWKVDRDNLLYAFAARGYKSGGYNSAVSTFRPETVWNYEIGWKSTMADGHIRTQIDAFYNDYKDFQFGLVDFASGQANVSNLPSATIKGIEAQIQAKFGGFSADGAVSYVDSHLAGFTAINASRLPPGQLGVQCAPGAPSNPPTCFDYTPFIGTAGGGDNLLSPRWTYNLGAQYEFSLGDEISLTPRLNYAYVGRQFTNLFYSPVTDRIAERGLLSALLTLRYRQWEVEGYGRNLTNKKYVLGQNGTNEFYGAPREYGVRVSMQF
ncbi:TonB-dependent receptor [Sphingobium sp. H39-3-25]|uniref:TonB-dependent receptor n=1 Tax=Sphingobium arseniciresistens TaxID=3030834 RepID=UPI0023B8E555|nr:TonB-dependent receptor [Sphingobium arseniciresistens]